VARPNWDPSAEDMAAASEELCRIWGSSLYQFGDYEQARVALEEAVELLGEWGPPDREAWACTILSGLLPHFEEDLGPSLAEASRAVEIFRAEQNDFGLATSLGLLGTLMTLVGRAEEGRARLEESVEAAQKLRLPSLIGANLTLRALGLLAAGEVADARRLLESAGGMPLYLEGTAYCLEGLAAVSLVEGDELRAATALGAAEGLRERTGIRIWPVLRMAFQPAIEALDAAGPEAQAARYEGSHMNPQNALARLVGEDLR
jgi:tetratricopeptide (TPR) repeat protein